MLRTENQQFLVTLENTSELYFVMPFFLKYLISLENMCAIIFLHN